MFLYIIVFACGGFGSTARYAISSLIGQQTAGQDFPWGTLAVNLIGAFLIGAVTTLSALKWNLTEPLRLAVVTGFLGGFTTFSAFSLDTMLMLTKGAYVSAAVYILHRVIGYWYRGFGFCRCLHRQSDIALSKTIILKLP